MQAVYHVVVLAGAAFDHVRHRVGKPKRELFSRTKNVRHQEM
jgi:hypothetical protein